MPSWISLTSLFLVAFVLLSISTDTVDGKKKEDVGKRGKDQSLGEVQAGKRAPGKAKLKLRKGKGKRRKAKSKKVKTGKIKHQGGMRKSGKQKGTKSIKRKGNSKGMKKKKNKKKKNKKKKTKKRKNKKMNDNRKMQEIEDAQNEESKESAAPKQVITNATATATITDPDRYKHCDYLDLVEVGYREDSTCKPGDKMVFKGGKGIRRQFLMTPQTNAVVFLELGKKVTSCNNVFNDITSKVRCKPVNGVKQISSMTKKNALGSTCTRCSSKKNCPAKPTTGSDAEITCRCPPSRFFACIYKVESNRNSHTVTCNEDRSVTKITCGSDLVAKTTGANPLERYSHPLCSTKEYTSILLDLTWSCKDKSIPPEACDKCDGTPCDGNSDSSETTADMSDSMSTRRPRRFQILN